MDILIDESDGSLWVTALEEGRLDGLEIDPVDEQVRWGSIYWAQIKGFNTALDAAYLDLDGENTGLLFNADTRQQDKDGRYIKGGAKSIAQTYSAGDFVIVQAKTGFRPADSLYDPEREENKIPKMSMDVTIPGRYLIYAPMMSEKRISSRIRDKALRKQLAKMSDKIDELSGCILRSSAANTQTDMLVREAKILRGAWDQMQQYFAGSEPSLIALGPDAIQRTLADHAVERIETIEIVIMDHFTQAEDWATLFAPDLVTKIKPIELENADQDRALFEYRDVMGQIEDLFHSYVLMKGGANIIIQQTAALTAIDINRGGEKNSNLAINLAAAIEIARQIRLRNLGGIIMIDFLKMNSKKDEGRLIAAMEDAVLEDPCTVDLHGMTALGLMELTRKRRTPPLEDRLHQFEF